VRIRKCLWVYCSLHNRAKLILYELKKLNYKYLSKKSNNKQIKVHVLFYQKELLQLPVTKNLMKMMQISYFGWYWSSRNLKRKKQKRFMRLYERSHYITLYQNIRDLYTYHRFVPVPCFNMSWGFLQKTRAFFGKEYYITCMTFVNVLNHIFFLYHSSGTFLLKMCQS
jgi:hypothetical protein